MIKNLIFLFGFSTFVTFVWISMAIYHSSVTSTISPANQIKIEPINSEFDTQTLEQLKERQQVTADLNQINNIIDIDENEVSTGSSEIEISPTPELIP